MVDDQDQADARMKLAQLQLEHGDLKTAIDAMSQTKCSPLAIQRLKKKKLELKDRIERISSTIIPNITA